MLSHPSTGDTGVDVTALKSARNIPVIQPVSCLTAQHSTGKAGAQEGNLVTLRRHIIQTMIWEEGGRTQGSG